MAMAASQTSLEEADLVSASVISISPDESRSSSVQTVGRDKDTINTEQPNIRTTSNEMESNANIPSKHSKRKKAHGSNHSDKQCTETTPTDILAADECSQDAGKNGEDGEDSTPTTTQYAMLGKTSVNNSILDEILNHKKRCLLESPEIVDFIRSRMQTS